MNSNNEQTLITIEDVDRELNSIVSKIQVLQDVRRFCEDIEVELWFKRLSAANKALGQDISPGIKWLSWSGEVEEWGQIKCPMFDDEKVTTYYPKGVSCVYTYTAPFVAEDGDICYYRYDLDEGCWEEDIIYTLCEKEDYKEGMVFTFKMQY